MGRATLDIRQTSRSYQLRVKYLLGLRSVNDAHTGAVTLVQRFEKYCQELKKQPRPPPTPEYGDTLFDIAI